MDNADELKIMRKTQAMESKTTSNLPKQQAMKDLKSTTAAKKKKKRPATKTLSNHRQLSQFNASLIDKFKVI